MANRGADPRTDIVRPTGDSRHGEGAIRPDNVAYVAEVANRRKVSDGDLVRLVALDRKSVV